MIKDTVGAVIGRFQIDELHAGHMALLNFVDLNYERMLILVGVRFAEASDTNPLGFEARKEMLQAAFPKATILPIVDCRSDEVWSRKVDEIIVATYGYGTKVQFHVGRSSFAPHYHGKFPIEQHHFSMIDVGATDKRNEIKYKSLDTTDARMGAIHAIMNLPHRHTIMVDMFVTRKHGDSYSILVGKKDGESQWRLPGGRVDKDESFRRAASRELMEETGISLTDGEKGWKIVDDFNVPDWRVRDTDRITYKTVLLAGEYSYGPIKAGDDLIEVKWLPLDEFRKDQVVKEHVHLFEAAIQFLDTNTPFFMIQSER